MQTPVPARLLVFRDSSRHFPDPTALLRVGMGLGFLGSALNIINSPGMLLRRHTGSIQGWPIDEAV